MLWQPTVCICSLVSDTRHFRFKADIHTIRQFTSSQKPSTCFCSHHIRCDSKDRYGIFWPFSCLKRAREGFRIYFHIETFWKRSDWAVIHLDRCGSKWFMFTAHSNRSLTCVMCVTSSRPALHWVNKRKLTAAACLFSLHSWISEVDSWS